MCMGVITLKVNVVTVTKSEGWFHPWQRFSSGVILHTDTHAPTRSQGIFDNVWRSISSS